MDSLHLTEETVSAKSDAGADRARSSIVIIVAVFCALMIGTGLFAGYLYLRKRHVEQHRAEQQPALGTSESSRLPPEVQAFIDDAMIKGAETVIGGTLKNISGQTLADLSVEIELKRRQDGNTERRILPVSPPDLAPDQRGRYSVNLRARDYSGARLVRILSGARSDDVAFKSVPGAQRPPERPPQTPQVIIQRPAPRSKGEEFINTPENPTRIQ